MSKRQNLTNTVKFLLAAILLVGTFAVQSAEARKCKKNNDRNDDGAAIGAIIGLILGAENGNGIEDAIIGAIGGAIAGAAIDELDLFEYCQVERIHKRHLKMHRKDFRKGLNRRNQWNGRSRRRGGYVEYYSHGYQRQTYCRDYTHVYWVNGYQYEEYGRYCRTQKGQWRNRGTQSQPYARLRSQRY